MFCIAAFIVLLVLSLVSAKYRRLVGKAWGCVLRRVTFRPCDTSFKEEVKGRLLAKVAVKKPQMVKSASVGIEVASWIIVIATIWSLLVVINSGLNLYVYGTCNPSNASSCNLGSETCSIESDRLSFIDSVREFKVHIWIANGFSDFGQTIAAIPTRMQNWKAEEYLPANVTYLNEYNPDLPTAVEAIDPGCVVCQKLFRNIKEAGFDERYNLAYIAYPIQSGGGYRFANSLLITQYLEAIRLHPLETAEKPVDWQVLERVFTGSDESGYAYQTKFNSALDHDQAVDLLDEWLEEFGYSQAQIGIIKEAAASDEVMNIIADNKSLVENRIKTVKIPTIIFDGRRHDGLVEVKSLS